MGDELDDSIEIIEEGSSAAISSAPTSKSSTSKAPAVVITEESTEVVTHRGNALYARLAVLMGKDVEVADALSEMKEMSKQIAARKRAAGVTELWDAGEEVCDPAAAAAMMGGRGGGPPPKRIGPPAAVVTGTANRLLPSPSLGDKRRPGMTMDKSSSSGSEESQDASSAFLDRAKASASEIPKATSKLCITCHEPGSGSSPLLTCSTCTLPTHAKCVKPPIEKEEYSAPRFSFTCSSCTRRPRSESPKPSAGRHHSAILMVAPHDKRKKVEVPPSKLAKADESKRKKPEGDEPVPIGVARQTVKVREKRQAAKAGEAERKRKAEEKGGDE